jgi:parallel beta-helix repeat protein
LPNAGNGVIIGAGASRNRISGSLEFFYGTADYYDMIGGSVAFARNIISGNAENGVDIEGWGNLLEGSYIGTDSKGSSSLLNNGNGVFIGAGAYDNTIGGSGGTARNIISGNGANGIDIEGSGNCVEGNYIGTDSKGSSSLQNNGNGVFLVSGASKNTIGGSGDAARNIISGNADAGVQLTGNGTSDNQVAGNYIGTDYLGGNPVSNETGVLVEQGASDNTIGGTAPSDRNTISGNYGAGVDIEGSKTTGNMVMGNAIGTDSTGTKVVVEPDPQSVTVQHILDDLKDGLGQFLVSTTNQAKNASLLNTEISDLMDQLQQQGVLITDAASNTISGNVLSGNFVGVDIEGRATGNSVAANEIGCNTTGRVAVGNVIGVLINGAPANTIGGSTSQGLGNTISGNALIGVCISGQATSPNLVEGNAIGLGNKTAFTTPVAPVSATSASSRKRQGRSSAVGASSSILFLQPIGVYLANTSGNTIGGLTPDLGNVITGNLAAGVYVLGQNGSSTGNQIIGNWIGMVSPATGRVPGFTAAQQTLYGVILFNAPQNTPAMSGRGSNHFGKHAIANFREYSGPNPSSFQTNI